MSQYQKAQFLMQSKYRVGGKIALADLLQAHRLVAANDRGAGGPRPAQNWVGGSAAANARFVPPPPGKLDELMTDWLAYINQGQIDAVKKALTAYAQFIVVHPFNDGNGRIARILVQTLLADADPAFARGVSPFLYRLAHGKDGYLDAAESMLKQDWTNVRQYWRHALSWSIRASAVLNQMAQQTHGQLRAKLFVFAANELTGRILAILWRQPIVTIPLLQQALGLERPHVEAQMDMLRSAGILQQHILRQPQNTVIYDCPAILECWQKMDEWLFTGQEEYRLVPQ